MSTSVFAGNNAITLHGIITSTSSVECTSIIIAELIKIITTSKYHLKQLQILADTDNKTIYRVIMILLPEEVTLDVGNIIELLESTTRGVFKSI